MNYCAVIADVVNSRLAADRRQVKQEMTTAVNRINSEYQTALTADFMIYAGDEVQGLLATPSVSYKLITDLRSYFSSVQLVFGVGVGEVTTEIPPDPVTWELDGPAYHRAREMIKQAKKKKPSICYSLGPEDDLAVDRAADLINSLLYFIESTVQNRTQRQKEVAQLYNEYGSQEKVAAKLGITQPGVSRILSKGFYSEVKQAEGSIRNYLQEFDKN